MPSKLRVTSVFLDFAVDESLLGDKKYGELYTSSYLLPSGGHRVFVLQPGMYVKQNIIAELLEHQIYLNITMFIYLITNFI